MIIADIPIWFEDGTAHIDVRRLEPPEPLVAILRLLESPEVGGTVMVIIDRDPVLLFEELEEKGWSWARLAAPAGEVHLRLVKDNAG